MLEALIEARDEPNSGFTDEEVVGNAITMVFAGEDTTSNTMAWLLEFLGDHPQAAARMGEEARQVLGERTVLDDYHLLDQLKYLDAATREAMRLKPVAPFMAAETNQDVVLGDLAVPAGTVIFMLLRHASERGCELAQPERFMPERWLESAAMQSDDPGRKLFPFGGGPRFCPGRYLAMVEIKMAMSMLARNFRLERVPGAPSANECFTFTMTPDALPVRLAHN
jgi:cytochrome P450